jgi:protein-S-isoprenylcysteine O-methyltransferase Ste14
VSGEARKRGLLHVALRPAFAVCLFLSQFISSRTSFFTDNRYVLGAGAALTAAGIALWAAAAIHLRVAQRAERVATSGPFHAIRHPIYASIYVLSIGLGLMFFAWTWFLVLVIFFPLWYRECRMEEEEMEERYGEAYATYRERTKMFIPGVL